VVGGVTGDATHDAAVAADDPLLANITTMVDLLALTRFCARVTNGGTIQNAGGTFITALVPYSVVGGVSFKWNDIQAYFGTQEVDMHPDFDVCMPWVPLNGADGGEATVSSAPSNWSTCMVIAWKSPTAQNIDVEVCSSYDILPLPGSANVLGSDASNVDDEIFEEIIDLIRPPANSGFGTPMATASLGRTMWETAKRILGSAANTVLGPVVGSVAEMAMEGLSELFGDVQIERFLRVMAIRGLKPDRIVEALEAGKIPKEVAQPLMALANLRVKITRTGWKCKMVNGDIFVYDYVDEKVDDFEDVRQVRRGRRELGVGANSQSTKIGGKAVMVRSSTPDPRRKPESILRDARDAKLNSMRDLSFLEGKDQADEDGDVVSATK